MQPFTVRLGKMGNFGKALFAKYLPLWQLFGCRHVYISLCPNEGISLESPSARLLVQDLLENMPFFNNRDTVKGLEFVW